MNIQNKTNYRNGTSNKKVKSNLDKLKIKILRNRKGEFEPIIVSKYSRDKLNIGQQIINLYIIDVICFNVKEIE